MTKSSQSRYAASEDWLRVRKTISQLYQDENKTLKEVMDIMERNYTFYATKKMYKNKIKEWGLDKKFKADEVLSMLHHIRERKSLKKESEFIVRGRKVDLTRLDRYLDRNPQLRARFERGDKPSPQAADEVKVRSPSPEPTQPEPETAPKADPPCVQAAVSLAYPELLPPPMPSPQPGIPTEPLEFQELLELVKDYVHQAFDSGKWYVNDEGQVRSSKGVRGRELLVKVVNEFETAADAMQRKEKVNLVTILGPAFDYLEVVVREETPALVAKLAYLCRRLQVAGREDLLGNLLDFGTNLTGTLLGDCHPLQIIWERLAHVVWTGRGDCLEKLERVLTLMADSMELKTTSSTSESPNEQLVQVCGDYTPLRSLVKVLEARHWASQRVRGFMTILLQRALWLSQVRARHETGNKILPHQLQCYETPESGSLGIGDPGMQHSLLYMTSPPSYSPYAYSSASSPSSSFDSLEWTIEDVHSPALSASYASPLLAPPSPPLTPLVGSGAGFAFNWMIPRSCPGQTTAMAGHLPLGPADPLDGIPTMLDGLPAVL